MLQDALAVLASPELKVAGGKGANEAVAVARLGVKTYLQGKVGLDASGTTLLQAMERQKSNMPTRILIWGIGAFDRERSSSRWDPPISITTLRCVN